jgi:hypothetical protein
MVREEKESRRKEKEQEARQKELKGEVGKRFPLAVGRQIGPSV